MKCWWTIPMPWSNASFGERKRTSDPLIRMRPSSGWYSPIRMFISVVLPAPFSPTRARTECSPTRITSYNVCYTKLLRTGISGILLIAVSLVLSMQDFVLPTLDWEWELLGRNALTVAVGILSAIAGRNNFV